MCGDGTEISCTRLLNRELLPDELFVIDLARKSAIKYEEKKLELFPKRGSEFDGNISDRAFSGPSHVRRARNGTPRRETSVSVADAPGPKLKTTYKTIIRYKTILERSVCCLLRSECFICLDILPKRKNLCLTSTTVSFLHRLHI